MFPQLKVYKFVIWDLLTNKELYKFGIYFTDFIMHR